MSALISKGSIMGYMFSFPTLALILVCAGFSSEAYAHARFRLNGTTPPRNTSTGLKTGPCGNVPRTNNPTILTAGQQLTVQWEETINHPGYYLISFSAANDANFIPLGPVVLDIQGVSQYQATYTVPNTPCTNCTLQMIQYMTEQNPPSLYFSCADIEIRAANPNPAPSPSPAPSPRPTVPAPGPTAPPSNPNCVH